MVKDAKFWRRERERGRKVEKRLTDNILATADESVMKTMNAMKMAKAYNNMTGANLSHWDLNEVGMLEEGRIIAAIQLWDL